MEICSSGYNVNSIPHGIISERTIYIKLRILAFSICSLVDWWNITKIMLQRFSVWTVAMSFNESAWLEKISTMLSRVYGWVNAVHIQYTKIGLIQILFEGCNRYCCGMHTGCMFRSAVLLDTAPDIWTVYRLWLRLVPRLYGFALGFI